MGWLKLAEVFNPNPNLAQVQFWLDFSWLDFVWLDISLAQSQLARVWLAQVGNPGPNLAQHGLAQVGRSF